MPNLNTRRVSDPDILATIRKDLLIEWLMPAANYLANRGCPLPDPAGDLVLDLVVLGKIFFEPWDDMPHELVDALYLINDMATPEQMDALIEEAENRHIVLEVGGDPNAADVAVYCWLRQKALLSDLHMRSRTSKTRRFEYFYTDAEPLPTQVTLSDAQRTALEARLNNWFEEKKRGRTARVFMHEANGEVWFMVRHGEPCRREGAIENGQAASVFYRPAKHDVLVYNIADGEIRINCCGTREQKEFLAAFGLHVFGRENFFPGEAKYTLEPLIKGPACLDWSGIEGIESVSLKEVEEFQGGKPWHKRIHRSNDIYGLIALGALRWPAVENIKKAAFEVKFVESKKTRTVKIMPLNKAEYGRDEDSVLVEKWLKKNEFILVPEASNGDAESVDEL